MKIKIILVFLLAMIPFIALSQDCTTTFPNLSAVSGVPDTVTITGGATPSGGRYSGTGVTDNKDGLTFDFAPLVAGIGIETISYTFDLLGDWQIINGSNQSAEKADGNGYGNHVGFSADGTRAVIGSNTNNNFGNNSGRVQVLDWDGTSWSQVGSILSGTQINDFYGDNVVITRDGGRIAIGALGFFGNARVEVFDFDGTDWVQVGGTISQPPGLDFDFFFGRGLSISDNGNRLAIGGEGNAAVTFEWDGTNWVQLGSGLEGTRAKDRFGANLALSGDGDRLVVTATENNSLLNNRLGYIRIYDWNGTDWVQFGSTIFGDSDGSSLGSELDISSDGSRILAVQSNVARVYEHNGTDWAQVGSDILQSNAIGISDDGNRLATGFSTSLRIYDWNGSAWTQVESLVSASSQIRDIALSQGGTPILAGGSGNVALFEQEVDCTHTSTSTLEIINPIPTMGQWALFVLALIISSLALIYIKQSKWAA